MLLTGAAYPTLAHVLRRRAIEHPRALAFRFLDSTNEDPAELTYGDLDRKACAIAAALRAEGVVGEPVLLLYQPGLDFITAFLGCLYAGAIAVPAYPPAGQRGQGLHRLRAIAADCGARLALTHAPVEKNVPAWERSAPDLSTLSWLRTEDLRDEGSEPPAPSDDPGRIAFLQYTSGSTASPRGAMVTHGNVMHNLECIRTAFGGDPETDHGVFWLPQYHDMGLTGGILLTCWSGSRSTILSPLAFVKRPLLWLRTISSTGATISGGPNFAYELCIKRIPDRELDHLDLSSWRIAFSGAETVQRDTCERFARRFARCGFHPEAFQPGYGLAESTLIVASRPPGSPLAFLQLDPAELESGRARAAGSDRARRPRSVVSCGAVVSGHELRIVDPETSRELPPLEVGEIWTRGPSVARGYWGRVEESEATFGAHLANGEGPFLRTGDLGFLDRGELFVTGRSKELLIVNGKNHYPLDVERTVHEADPEVSACAAVSAAREMREDLVLVCQTASGRRLGARALAISKAVSAEHGLQVHEVLFVAPGAIPRTSSGKIQRRSLALDYEQGRIERLEERSEDEATAAIIALLTSEIAAGCGRPESSIDIRAPFVSYGLASVDAVRITGKLEERLGRSLSPTLAYEYPTIEALARYLATGEEPHRADAPSARPASGEEIAIVGMACRFPGAPDLASFEKLLRAGLDAIGPMPAGRAMEEASFPEAGYLDQVDRFAADFFAIDAAEAAAMDPQQRLLLELAWHALEDAGLPAARSKGSATGVWVGISSADYALERFGDPHAHPHSHAAQAHSIAANRISYQFDFQGPSLSVDTACSSSLVALHLACQAIRAGECEMALVGGVNVLLSRSVTEQFERGGYMSKTHRCRPFDSAADGYVRGEGAAVVVLKPLSRALADRDRIYAVVRGTACNQDGRTNGLTAPSRIAQEALLRRAYAEAGIDPTAVPMVEAHGTGTPLGDPIEARALGSVLGSGRSPLSPCRIGSVKSNIGHLEAGAGIAGLVKAALSIHTRTLYPTCHYREPNSNIDFPGLSLRVQSVCEPWPEGLESVAGVSSFGFGGTNAHAVLAAAPPTPSNAESQELPLLLPLSSPSLEELPSYTAAVAAALTRESARDVAFTLGVRRSHHRHRAAVLGRESEELVRGLHRASLGATARREKIAFLFGGQGGQWLGMGRDLIEHLPGFRKSIERIDSAIEDEAGWSLLASLDDPSSHRRIDRVQPMLFALGVALSETMRAWGVEPDLLIGQSMGEITAAVAARALSLEDGVRAIVRRSALLSRLSGRGAMAMVDLAAEDALRRIRHPGVTVAVHASPTTCVIAGEERSVREVTAELEREGIGVRPIQVDVASHCPLVDSLSIPLRQELSGLRGRGDHLPMLSSVTARALSGRDIDPDYLWRNLREPVRFTEAVEEALAAGIRWFVEIGPHPVLTGSVRQRANDPSLLALPTLKRDSDGLLALLETVGTLYERGLDPDWAAILPAGRVVDLPQPSLPRKRYWTEPATRRSSSDRPVHPLLDREIESAALDDRRVFELLLSAAAFPDLVQHRVAGVPVLSAGALLEISRAAVEKAAACTVALERVRFERILPVPLTGSRTVQVVVGAGTFAIFGRGGSGSWTRHVSGEFREAGEERTEAQPSLSSHARSIEPSELYAKLADRGLEYGPSCQRIAEIRCDGEACELRIEAHQDLATPGYAVHPLLLDMCLQALAPLSRGDSLLGGIGEFRILRRPEGPVVARASSNALAIFDPNGLVARASGIELGSLEGRALRDPDAWRKKLLWSRSDAAGSSPPARSTGALMIISTSRALSDALAETAPPDAAPTIATAADLADFVRSARGGARLWLVTRAAFEVNPEEGADPMQAALQAAARAGWAEGAFEGGAIDLDPHPPTSLREEAELVWREIAAGEGQRIAAFRGGRRYEPRLAPSADAAPVDLAIDVGSTYLVTGGLGDLGLHAARWLVRRGARRLVLCGRSSVSGAEKWKELEAAGATVTYRSLDVSDRLAVEALAREVSVAGIVHAAGAVELCPFQELDERRIAEAFRPKARGAENLAACFAGPELKFLLLYASSSSWLGALGRGLAHYAAANGYLEALASKLARTGVPAVAVCWPPWHGLGRVKEAAAGGHFSSMGVATIAAEEADEVLSQLHSPVTMLCAIDRARYPFRGADRHLLSGLDDGPSVPFAGERLAEYEPPRGLLEERLSAAWREVLGVERVGRNDSFFALGGSSVKAATLLNRLRRHTTDEISIVALFEAPTVANLAAYLRERHRDCADAIEAGAPVEREIPAADGPAELLARIERLSEEEVETLLLERENVDAG